MCNFILCVGGFGTVFVGEDVESGQQYAIKRMLGHDKQACNNIIRELNFNRQLSGHPNIVKFVAVSLLDHTANAQGFAEYLMVSELCKGKTAFNLN